MTHSKSWARRRAVQVLRALKITQSTWFIRRIDYVDGVALLQTISVTSWTLFGGWMFCGDEALKLKLERASEALQDITIMAGSHGS